MQPTDVDPREFIASVENARRREDASVLVELLEEISGHPAQMWGPSIIGFGSYHYRYASGHEGDAPALGFSPRKAHLVIYAINDTEESAAALADLGKYKRSTACLYVNKLADIDPDALRRYLVESYRHVMDAMHRPDPDSGTTERARRD
nr:DUF1801 domain-containing protein [Zhihengliuella flava]